MYQISVVAILFEYKLSLSQTSHNYDGDNYGDFLNNHKLANRKILKLLKCCLFLWVKYNFQPDISNLHKARVNNLKFTLSRWNLSVRSTQLYNVISLWEILTTLDFFSLLICPDSQIFLSLSIKGYHRVLNFTILWPDSHL